MTTHLRELLAKATEGPWSYRPDPYDDWGVIRGSKDDEGRQWLIMQASDPRYRSEECLNEHRRNKTDPWEANAALIVAARNELPTILDRLDAAEAEVARYKAIFGSALSLAALKETKK